MTNKQQQMWNRQAINLFNTEEHTKALNIFNYVLRLNATNEIASRYKAVIENRIENRKAIDNCTKNTHCITLIHRNI